MVLQNTAHDNSETHERTTVNWKTRVWLINILFHNRRHRLSALSDIRSKYSAQVHLPEFSLEGSWRGGFVSLHSAASSGVGQRLEAGYEFQ